MASAENPVPAPIRAINGVVLAVQILIAAGAFSGGVVQIVGGLVDTDWARLASGAVGLLLGGAFAAMAYAHWSARPHGNTARSD